MRRDEQIGLVALVLCLLLYSLLMDLVSGGRIIETIFENTISRLDYNYNPDLDALLLPLQQQLSRYWLVGTIAASTALLTLIAIIGYRLIRRRVPKSWALFLLLGGTVTSVMTLFSLVVQSVIQTIPVRPRASMLRDGLVVSANGLLILGLFGGVLALLGLFCWASTKRHRNPAIT